MAAGLTLFQIELPTIGKLTARRLFNDQEGFPYELEPGGGGSEFWRMEVHEAVRLGQAAGRIDFRLREASRRQEAVKACAPFHREVKATKELIIELGIVDNTAIYLQMFEWPRAVFQGEHIGVLLAALLRLGADARGIPGAPGPGNSVASRLAGYRQRSGDMLANLRRALDKRLGWE